MVRIFFYDHLHIYLKNSEKDGVDPFESYKSLGRKDWHDYEAMKRDAERQGLGENGKPVAVPADPAIKKIQVYLLLLSTSFQSSIRLQEKSEVQVRVDVVFKSTTVRPKMKMLFLGADSKS